MARSGYRAQTDQDNLSIYLGDRTQCVGMMPVEVKSTAQKLINAVSCAARSLEWLMYDPLRRTIYARDRIILNP